MVSRPRSFRSLRDFAYRVPNNPKEAHSLFHELLSDPNDRAAGITGAAYLESRLEEVLTFKLRKIGATDVDELFRGDAPLATFAAKISFAVAIGLFGKQTRHDFDCIREIRSAFAHSRLKATFATPEVRAVCMRIKFPKWGSGKGAMKPDEPEAIRVRFLATCTLYNDALAEMATPGPHSVKRWLDR